MLNILIADDHEITRRGLRELLRDAFEAVDICEVADAASLLARLGERAWDLILLDVMMPGSNILDTLAAIRAGNANVLVLVLTAATEPEIVLQTMRAGANGLIHKHRAADELVDAIRKVISEGNYLHPETAIAIAAALRAPGAELPHLGLSARELEIFRLLALGRSVKEVGFDLGISDKTVATYISRIREKTGLNSLVEIARYALRHGLVE